MVDKEKDIRVLLCCSAGMSSSIVVKSLREAAKGSDSNYKFAAVVVSQVKDYIHTVDYVLIAPQINFEYDYIKKLAQPFNVKVFILDATEYGNVQGDKLFSHIENDNIFRSQSNQNIIKNKEEEMDKLSQSLEKYLLPFANKLGSNKVLRIIRDAFSSTVALLIIGSISILLTNFPQENIANLLAPTNDFFNTIYAFTSGMMGLVTTAAIAYYASQEYKTVTVTSVITSVVAFLITQSYILDGWPSLNVDGLGVSGLMSGMLIAFVSVKVLQLFQDGNIGIKMPEGVPEAITQSFLSLIPAIAILGGVTLLTVVGGFDLNAIIGTLLSPLAKFLNTLPGYMLYHMLAASVFFLGINSAVVIGVFQVFLTSNSLANEAAFAAGETVKFVATNSVDTMIWAGGTGATIGLVLLMTFTARSKFMKTLGKISMGPGIFNINEPVIFGIPLAFNPLFLIPFVLTPGLLAGATYLLMSNNIIAMPIIGNVPWTIPPVFVGYAMSGGAISTTIWSGLVVLISGLIYYPFFRIADKQMLKQEQEEEQKENQKL